MKNSEKTEKTKKSEKSDKKELPPNKNKNDENLNEITIKLENISNFKDENKILNALPECSPIINRKKRRLIMDEEENEEEEENVKKIKKENNEVEEKEQRFKRLFKMRNLEKNVCPICLSKKF